MMVSTMVYNDHLMVITIVSIILCLSGFEAAKLQKPITSVPTIKDPIASYHAYLTRLSKDHPDYYKKHHKYFSDTYYDVIRRHSNQTITKSVVHLEGISGASVRGTITGAINAPRTTSPSITRGFGPRSVIDLESSGDNGNKTRRSNGVAEERRITEKSVIREWADYCFTLGYNNTDGKCRSPVDKNITESIARAPNKEECGRYYEAGCAIRLDTNYCNYGLRKGLEENFNCASIDLPDDEKTAAFQCCMSCKSGITQGILTQDCRMHDDFSLSSQASQFCCNFILKKSVTTTLVPSLEPNATEKSGSFEEVVSFIDKIHENASMNPQLNTSSASSDNSSLAVNVTTEDLSSEVNSTDSITVSSTQSTPNAVTISDSSFDSSTESSTATEKVSSEDHSESLRDLISVAPMINHTETTTISTTTATSSEAPTTTVKSTEATTALSSADKLSSTFNPNSEEITILRKSETSDTDSSLGYKCKSGECEDINECEGRKNPCKDGQQCFNTHASYKCCPMGFEFDNEQCIYPDKCKDNSCNSEEYCVNTYKDYYCEPKVPEGYKKYAKANALEKIDVKDSSKPDFLVILQKDIDLPKESFEEFSLLNISLRHNVKCEWNFNIEKVEALDESKKLRETDFKQIDGDYWIALMLKRKVESQTINFSVVCNVEGTPYFMERLLLHFGHNSTKN